MPFEEPSGSYSLNPIGTLRSICLQFLFFPRSFLSLFISTSVSILADNVIWLKPGLNQVQNLVIWESTTSVDFAISALLFITLKPFDSKAFSKATLTKELTVWSPAKAKSPRAAPQVFLFLPTALLLGSVDGTEGSLVWGLKTRLSVGKFTNLVKAPARQVGVQRCLQRNLSIRWKE